MKYEAICTLTTNMLIIVCGVETLTINLSNVSIAAKDEVKRISEKLINGETISFSQDELNELKRKINSTSLDVYFTVDYTNSGNMILDGVELSDDEHDDVERLFNDSKINAIRNIIKFKQYVNNNPSYKVIKRLYDFIKVNDLKIVDGKVHAYKVIKSNNKDVYSGTIDNSVGQVVTMPRSQVDDDDNNTCSTGLHVCSSHYIEYFDGYNRKLALVEVDPADFVSIPTDYANSKARTCKYKVIKHFTKQEADDILNKHELPDYGNTVKVDVVSLVKETPSIEELMLSGNIISTDHDTNKVIVRYNNSDYEIDITMTVTEI